MIDWNVTAVPYSKGLTEEQRERQAHALRMHGHFFTSESYHVHEHKANRHAIEVLRGEARPLKGDVVSYVGDVILVAHEHPDGDY